MSWVTVIWPIVVSACLTLAAVRLLVWWRGWTVRECPSALPLESAVKTKLA